MNFQPREPHFNRQKLLDVVLFVCNECSPADLGNVKLHKILYFSDMLHYMETGEALTGAEYQKQKFGPTARHLSWAVEQLSRDGALKASYRDYFGFKKVDYVALKKPSSDALSNMEMQLLSEVIDFVCARSAREISELSHNDVWRALDVGEKIPYFTAYAMQPVAVSDEDVAAAETDLMAVKEFTGG